jgi:SPP1 gp7 family putative phage head morphogenesis protein
VQETKSNLVVRTHTNAPKAIAKLFETLENRIQNQFPDTILRRWAMNMIGSVNRANKSNLKKITKAVDLDIEPLIDKDHHELSPYFNNIVDENVQLIRTIPKSQLGSLQNALVNAIKNDMSQKDIAGIVRKYFATNDGHAANKARLIARDQVNKLNGKLNQYRQQKLGGKRYRWKGMLDSAERPDHRKLQNKIFSWDNPPVVDSRTGRRGHPGEDYQCRCYPELVFEDIIE